MPKLNAFDAANQTGEITMTDRDPFAEGERAARENIPAEANPYQDGSNEHALWAAGHEKVAGAIEASESEGS
ncbi:hypothetical protein [Bradyrhizobium canariense]|uniref:hypothetical protein n=1 Tax=Bradyrhizobium canariense TaxID=255045 RepID=UPI001B8A5067|nr:hypothetical protein [Bradyrhizobium canariense]MBR0952824.1 hypothetical protein [Bradyrhizobium canariense]